MAQVRREGERGGGSFPEARDIWGGGVDQKYWKWRSRIQMAFLWPEICIKSIFGRGSAPDSGLGTPLRASPRLDLGAYGSNEVVIGPCDNGFPAGPRCDSRRAWNGLYKVERGLSIAAKMYDFNDLWARFKVTDSLNAAKWRNTA